MRKIIAIGGEALVGKDTFAEPLLNRGYVQLAFADNLKRMCMKVFNLSEFHVYSQKGKFTQLNPKPVLNEQALQGILTWMKTSHDIASKNKEVTELRNKYIVEYKKQHGDFMTFDTPRVVLQFVGTEICRALYPDYHAETLIYHINKNKNQNYVITDARFPNEREVLKMLFNATLVRIKRPGKTPNLDNNSEAETQGMVGHASENSLGVDEEYDIVIVNNGSITDLQDEAMKLA